MVDQQQQKTIIDPDLSDVLMLHKRDIFATLNCVKIGKILSFDGTKKTASIQILFKRLLPSGAAASYQKLLDCPVFTLQGGGAYVQMPIAAGDNCIVLFSDRALDDWFQSGSEQVPSSARMHDLSDGIAIVGLNAMNSSGPVTPSDKTIFSYKDQTIELSSSGLTLKASQSAEIDLTTVVAIKNNTTTLLTLMNGFITLLEAAQVQGPGSDVYPFTAAFITLLEAYKAQFAELLA